MRVKESLLAGLNKSLGREHDNFRFVTAKYADILVEKKRTEQRIELLEKLIEIEEEERASARL